MNSYAFSLAGTDLVARADRSLWWPEERLLCVSDLHLGKSERIARRGGGLLPPYETQETLWRLEAAIAETAPRHVVCLGDSFDDLDAATGLDDASRGLLTRMQAGRQWIWIEGNHDPGPVDLGGSHRDELRIVPLVFRHIAMAGPGEVSGHYHPKARVPGAAGARPCFLLDDQRLIMPAFGAYTGGLGLGDPALSALVSDRAIAILTGRSATPVPAAACRRPLERRAP